MTIFKMNRFNKITQTHYEMVSDAMIVNNIINLSDAKKVLSRDQFTGLINKFNYYRSRKEEYPTNTLIYENRAMVIIYMLEFYSEASYEDFCGDSIDLLYVYGTKREMIHSIFTSLYDDMKGLIQLFWDMEDNDQSQPRKSDSDVMALSIMFFRELFAEIFRRKNNYEMDYMFRSLIDDLILILLGNYAVMFGGTPRSFNAIGTQIREIRGVAARNTNSLDDFINYYTNSFLRSIGRPDNPICKSAIREFVDETMDTIYE